MFSGIIQEKSKVFYKNGSTLVIPRIRGGSKLGDSIAINGVCLTLARKRKKGKKNVYEFHVSAETRQKTTLSRIKVGAHVNIERALKLEDALGGHIVQGHVDGTGIIEKIIKKGPNRDIWVTPPKSLLKYLVYKGSIAIDGVSLTVSKVKKGKFCVSLIPFTLKHTTLSGLKQGDRVNLEADIMAKYAARYIGKK